MPTREMGLRLWDCVTGAAAGIIHDEDTRQEYNHEDGVARLLTRIAFHFASDDMVELGSRTDQSFDKLSRHEGEELVQYLNRFEKSCKRLTDIGESLSERARINRLLKGSRLDKRDQRELIMAGGGVWPYDSITRQMRLHNEFFKGCTSSTPSSTHRPQERREGRGHRPGEGSGGRGHKVNELHGDIGEESYDHGDGSDGGNQPSLDAISEGAEQGAEVDKSDAIDDFPWELQNELDAVDNTKVHSVNALNNAQGTRRDQVKSARDVLQKPADKRTAKEKETLQQLKHRTLCAVCGASGHWHSDSECLQYETTMREKDAARKQPRAGAHSTKKNNNSKKKAHGVAAVTSSTTSERSAVGVDGDVAPSPIIGNRA